MVHLLECPIGYYGRNCLQQCSENCYVTSRCDRVTGQCDRGCKPGWRTITCDKSKIFVSLCDQSVCLCFQYDLSGAYYISQTVNTVLCTILISSFIALIYNVLKRSGLNSIFIHINLVFFLNKAD